MVTADKPKIHPTAVIPNGAKISSGVEIGPYSCIGKDVEIGENTYIGPHVIIEGRVSIGSNCKLIAACSIGMPPQDLTYKGEDTGVKIGNNTVIREYVTIHKASKEGFTVVGENCFLMNYVHIGHNVQVGNNVIMANSAMLPGYVIVEDYVFISGLSTIHQHCKIGESAIVGALTGSRLDLPPYFIADGRPARIRGLNRVGLKRRGVKPDVRNELMKAYKLIYHSELNMKNAIERVETELVQFDEIKKLITFYKTSKRGVVGAVNDKSNQDESEEE
jgi:UDP-N-acetylglucosamine acyltransferase